LRELAELAVPFPVQAMFATPPVFAFLSILVVVRAIAPASYSQSSAAVKWLVGGLTSLSNVISINSQAKQQEERSYMKPSLTPNEVLQGIRGDFERGYLFSGLVDGELYAEEATFTDPTLSFEGFSTFEKNIKAIRPLIERFVGDNLVVLYDSSLDESSNQVKASWRMKGAINLPWKPVINLTGQTAYRVDASKGGRIVAYDETWNLPALEALLQLLVPAAKETTRIGEQIKAVQSNAVSTQAYKSSLLAACKSKNKAEIERCVNVLTQIEAKENRSSAVLEGTKWALAFTDSKGGSQGKVGPFQGVVSQSFPVTPSKSFFNTVSFLSDLIVIEQAGTFEEASLPSKETSKVLVSFVSTDVSIGGISIYKFDSPAKGFWRNLYTDKDLRIFRTNAASLFVLTLAKNERG